MLYRTKPLQHQCFAGPDRKSEMLSLTYVDDMFSLDSQFESTRNHTNHLSAPDAGLVKCDIHGVPAKENIN